MWRRKGADQEAGEQGVRDPRGPGCRLGIANGGHAARRRRARHLRAAARLSNQAEEAKSGGKDIKKEERQNKTRSRALRFGRLERCGGTLEALRNQLATASSPAANSW